MNKTRKTIEQAKFHLQIFIPLLIVVIILSAIRTYIPTYPNFNTSLIPTIIMGSTIASTILYTLFLIYSKIQNIKDNKKAQKKINEYINAINTPYTIISKESSRKKIKTPDFDKLSISYIPFGTVEIYMFDMELSTKNTGNTTSKDRKQKTKRHIKEYIKNNIRSEITDQYRFIDFYPKEDHDNTSTNDTITIGIDQSSALKYPKEVYKTLTKIKNKFSTENKSDPKY